VNGLPEFESVVKLYEPLVKKFLAKYHLIYDFDEYQQIAWIALWDAYRHYDPKKGPFPAFASATLRGCLLTEIKRRKKYSDLHETTDQIQELSSYESMDEGDQFELMFNLSHLSRREREWLKAAIFEDQSTKEIASSYHVTQDTVRSWKKSAIKKLKQQLKGKTT
jgi:RNA polymerase sigma factor (sigma-70 family)